MEEYKELDRVGKLPREQANLSLLLRGQVEFEKLGMTSRD
jgi:hypothetical protein